MSVWRRFDGHGFPSIVTTNIEGRRPLFGSTTTARMLLQVISEVRQETRLSLLAFVIMPDHIHLVIASAKQEPVSRAMRLIKGRFANRYNRMNRAHGRVWQERYHERALRSERQLTAAIEYVHGNPVKAGLTGQAESFPWSSAHPANETDLEAYLS